MDKEHLHREELPEEAKETVGGIAKELKKWIPSGDDMQHMDEQRRLDLRARVAELYDRAQIRREDSKWGLIRMNVPEYFKLSSGLLLLIPISVPQDQRITVTGEPFEVGWMTYITTAVRIEGMKAPVEFLWIHWERKS